MSLWASSSLHCPPPPVDVLQEQIGNSLQGQVPEHLLIGKTEREKEIITRGYFAFSRFHQQESAALAQSAQEGHAKPTFVVSAAGDNNTGTEGADTAHGHSSKVSHAYPHKAAVVAVQEAVPAPTGRPRPPAVARCRGSSGNKRAVGVVRVNIPPAVQHLVSARTNGGDAYSGSHISPTRKQDAQGRFTATSADRTIAVHRGRAVARQVMLAATPHTISERIALLNTPTSNVRTAYWDGLVTDRSGGHSHGARVLRGSKTALVHVPSVAAPAIGRNTRHFLSLEDFDDDQLDAHTPTAWVALGRRHGGTPALSKCYQDGGSDKEGSWEPCRVLSYDNVTSTFTVQWDSTGKKKKVKRLNLLFQSEDKELWQRRIAEAQRRRDETEEMFRLMLYVDSMDNRLVAPLSENQIDRILALAAREYPVRYLPLVDRFLELMKRFYTHSVKLAIHLYKYQSPEEWARLAPLGLPPPPSFLPAETAVGAAHVTSTQPLSLTQLRAVVKAPSPNFAVARVYIRDNLFFVHPLLQTTLRTLHLLWNSYVADRLFDVEFIKAKLVFPCELHEFELVYSRRVAAVVDRLKDEWSPGVMTTIQHHLDTLFNFYEDNAARYASSRMMRFISLVNVMMNTQLRSLVLLSVHALTEFFVRFQAVVNDVLLVLPSNIERDDDWTENAVSQSHATHSYHNHDSDTPSTGYTCDSRYAEPTHSSNYINSPNVLESGEPGVLQTSDWDIVYELDEDRVEREYWEAKAAQEASRRQQNGDVSKVSNKKGGPSQQQQPLSPLLSRRRNNRGGKGNESTAVPGTAGGGEKQTTPTSQANAASSGMGSANKARVPEQDSIEGDAHLYLPFPPYRSDRPFHRRVLALTSRPSGLQPLFVIRLTAEANRITYSPTLEHVHTRALSMFDTVSTTATQIHGMGHQILPLLSIPPYVLRPLNEREIVVDRSRDIVSTVFEQNAEAPRELVQMYGCFAYILQTDPKTLADVFLETPQVDLLERYDLAVDRLTRDQKRIVRRTPDVVRYELYVVECDGLKRTLVDKAAELRRALLTQLAARLDEDCRAAIKCFEKMYDRVAFQPSTPEELQELKTFIDHIPEQEAELEATHVFITKGHEMLVNYEYVVNPTAFEAYWTMYEWPKKLHQRLDVVQFTCKEFRNYFQQELRENCEKLSHSLTLLTNEVDELMHLWDEARADEYYLLAKNIDARIRGYQRDVALYNSHQELFGQPLSQWPQLKETKALFDPHFTVWEVVYMFNAEQERWMSARIASLNPVEVDNQVAEWIRKLVLASKRITEAEPTEVVKHTRAHLEEFKSVIPLLYALRSNLQATHWRAIFLACGIPRDKLGGGAVSVETNESRSLGDFVKMSMLEHLPAIEGIAAVAQKTFELESELLAMEGEWRKLLFEMEPYMDTLKLKANDSMQQTLDEHIIKTQSMLGKPIVRQSPHLQVRVVQWEKQLNSIQTTMDEWFRCQGMWSYLEPIFSSADISRSLPAEKLLFVQVDESWHKIMETTRNAPQILTRCQDTSLLDILIQNNELLEQVQRKLQQFLETKRMVFPRFYFISNEELLQILSDSKDPQLVQPYLAKCFEGIKRIRFAEGNEIVGMESAEGEYVEFVHSVNPASQNNQVELWLLTVEAVMKESVREQLRLAHGAYPREKRTSFIRQWPGQVVIAICSVFWTMEATQAMEGEGTLGLTAYRETCNAQLDDLIVLVRDRNLSTVQRSTLEALVVIEVHARDIISDLSVKGVDSPKAFDWLAQLRYYLDVDEQQQQYHLRVAQINASLRYGYEYLGNTGRLVITPLTDRCYRTLMGALHLNYGGAPEGPAGTGKTETTKDLAKALGKYCVVYNCSDQITSKDMAKLFKGLAQSGSWSCFDEFNRIEVQVLSVIAQQVASIQEAIAQRRTEFIFDGGQIRLDPGCAVFITMNPGYAGRAELPDNLKALFRPVAMMVPNYAMIGEIQLYSYGFLHGKVLAEKIVATYRLCSEQLSSQDHYDYGMRAVKTVLTAAGRLKRLYPDEDESVLMLRSIEDVNVPKFLSQDVELFKGIVSDLFPGVVLPPPEYDSIHSALQAVCEKDNLQLTSYFEKKICETYEMIIVRHGMMIVGYSYGGKTKALCSLAEALGLLEASGLDHRTRLTTINPKAVTMAQLYGKVEQSGEWTDGILANRFRQAAQDTSTDRKWIVLDGPVDAVWIENMNTVLDDNKKLCLQNGDIIPMSKSMNMIFEVQDLAHASPATVSRCGMVYVEPDTLGWECLVESYCNEAPTKMKENAQLLSVFRTLVKALFSEMLEVVRKQTKTIVPQGASIAVASFIKLFHSFACTLDGGEDDAIPIDDATAATALNGSSGVSNNSKTGGTADEEGGDEGMDARDALKRIEGWFLFSMVWSLGGCLTQKDRLLFSEALHSQTASTQNTGRHRFTIQLPERKQSFYDVHFTTKNGEPRFVDWLDTVSDVNVPENSEFQDIIVPTGDTAKYTFLAATLIRAAHPILLVGDTGTGKTIMIKSLLQSLPKSSFAVNSIQFSAQTLASRAQHLIDSRCERRRRGHYGPPINKRMVVFIDDTNLPQLEEYGAQPPIELLRQLIDEGGWYHHTKESIEYRNIADVQLVCAMGPAGGGRNPITQRFIRHFNTVSVPAFNDSTLKRVFVALADWMLTRCGFGASLRGCGTPLVAATIDLYDTLVSKLKPTPEKSHYTFNMRDISKVFQGISMANPLKIEDQRKLYLLWLHEVSRAFADRFVEDVDTNWFTEQVERVMVKHFKMSATTVKADGDEPVIFCPYMNDQGNYDQLESLADARRVLEDRLEQYNLTTRSGSLDLVVFQYVIEHVSRICRVLKQTSGNLLLIGVGGSGRRSCAKLAAYLQEFDYSTIIASKSYHRTDFHDDIRQLLLRTGMNGYSVVFTLTDMQITDESFLEDICSLLNTGEVPGLWESKQDRDTLDNAVATLRDIGKELGRADTTEALQELFVERCKKHLHMVLCFSPAGKALRERLRKFPSLVNCTTIDWFREWPDDGLHSVARRFLAQVPELSKEQQSAIQDIFVAMHLQVGQLCHTYLEEMRQHTYVTPTSYLELLNTFGNLLIKKKNELIAMRTRYDNGLHQLRQTEDDVKVMQAELARLQPELARKQKQTDELIAQVERESKMAEEQRAIIAVDEAAANKQAAAAMSIKDASQAKVDEAQPLVEQAQRAVLDLDPKALQEVKALKAPPQGVKYVVEVLCTLLGGTYKPKPVRDPLTGKTSYPYWEHAKLTLLTGEFKNVLLSAYPVIVDTAPDDQIEEVKKKMESDMFKMENIRKTSVALVGVATYVKAVVEYYRQNKIIKPLLAQAAAAQQEFNAAMVGLNKKKEELRVITEKLEALKAHLERVRSDQQALEDRIRDTDTKLTRARVLIEGLGGEKARYTQESERFSRELKRVVGDVVVSSGAIAYLGPFLSQYRQQMLQSWMSMCEERAVLGSDDFSLSTCLGSPIEIQGWKLQGLPTDSFSVDNAVIMSNTSRWPLLVDPQQQANNWIRNLEGHNGLIVVRPTEDNYIRTISTAVQDGVPILLENLEEDIDPTLENLLLKRFTKEGRVLAVHIGEPVVWNPSFRLYITTKLPRPHYRPEVCSMVTIINFVITQHGLQDQLLQRVMMSERRDIEEKKQALTVEAASNQASLKQSEDAILAILSSEGNILESETAIEELDRSKLQSDRIAKRQEEIEATDRVSNRTRALFAPAAELGAMLFFCVTELSNIDPMYQYSLQFYVSLFQAALTDSPRSESVDERIKSIKETFELLLFRTICRSLFGKDRLLFAFTMALRILQANSTEVRWLLMGGFDKDTGLTPNPFPSWLPDPSWRAVWRASTQLGGGAFAALPHLLATHEAFFMQFNESRDPLALPMPEEVSNIFHGLHQLILVRCFRVDKIVPAVSEYVRQCLGEEFVEAALFSLETVVDELGNDPSVPVVFVLSPGADPNAELDSLAEARRMSNRTFKLSLGQGQDTPARELIENGWRKGHWILLQNCHLYKDFMPSMARIIEAYSLPGVKDTLHRDFRLWLTSLPSSVFPVSVLQNGLKLVLEPPQGLRSNLLRSYLSDPIADPRFFESATKPDTWRKMLFGLCFFHSLVQERRGFGPLGWNRPYEFNDTDMRISVKQLRMFLEENEEVPYEALMYLTGQCNYGGRITDDWDRRCAMAILEVFYNPLILDDGYVFSSEAPEYYTPPFGDYESYIEYIQSLPLQQSPYVFGLHSNADITKDERNARQLLEATLMTQPRHSVGQNAGRRTSQGGKDESGEKDEEDGCGSSSTAAAVAGALDPKAVVMQLAMDVASRMPPLFDVEAVQRKYPMLYEESMNTVLLQEIIRYNRLLAVVRRTILEVQDAINGTVVMSAELEQVFGSLFDGKVPDAWRRRSYPSLKPFGSYVDDLLRRIAFLQKWIDEGPPPLFWLSGFFFTQSFLTGVMQNYARRQRIEIDKLVWKFTVMTEGTYGQPPENGCYINGLFLEGAGWNKEGGYLCESNPKELFIPFPTLRLQPARQEEIPEAPKYVCPCYKTTDRRGTLSTTGHSTNFILAIHLPIHPSENESHWIMRGTALFTQLDY